MKKKEALNQLKSLHYLLEHFQEIESRVEDVKALDYAINELEKTAPEVPVQEQYVGECEKCGHINEIISSLKINPKYCMNCREEIIYQSNQMI